MRISNSLTLVIIWLAMAGTSHGASPQTLSESSQEEATLQKTHDNRRPQVAFDACKEKSLGSSCLAQTPHFQLKGTCRQSRDSQLFCVPDGNLGPPPPPPGYAN